MKLGRITNTDIFIDEKVKLFYDNFNYALSNNRTFEDYSLENHLTLLDRLKFRLKNKFLNDSTIRVLKIYFKDHSLFTNSDYISRKGKFKSQIIDLKNLLDKKDVNRNIQELVNVADKLYVLFNEHGQGEKCSYIDQCLERLIKLLTEENDIKLVNNEIVYYSYIIAAEFIRNCFSIEQIINPNDGIFSRVLSKEVQFFDNDELYSKFPLPNYIKELQGEKGFKQKVEKFLEGRTFYEQFRGILTYLNFEKTGDFLFAIDSVFVNSNIKITYQDMEVITKDNLNIDISTWDSNMRSKFEMFTSKENRIFILVPSIKFRSDRNGYNNALRKAREIKDILNYKLGRGGVINEINYYVFYEKGMYSRFGKDILSFSGISENEKTLDDFGSKIQNIDFLQKIERCNNIYFKSMVQNYWEDSITYYWQYFESIYTDEEYKEKNKAFKIIDSIVKVLINDEIKQYKKKKRALILDILVNNNHLVLGTSISWVEMHSWVKTKFNNFKIQEFDSICEYPFYQLQVSKYKSANDSINIEKARCYYKSVLVELYEQRNYINHQGRHCSSTVEKLIRLLPDIIVRYRRLICEELSNNSLYNNFNEVI